MTPSEIIESYFAAWNRHDGEALSAAFAPNGAYHDPNTRDVLQGPDITRHAGTLWKAFPDLTFKMTTVLGGEESVAAEWIMMGTNGGTWHGFPPTERKVNIRGGDFFAFDGTAIRSVRRYFDSHALAGQLGRQVLIQPDRAGPIDFGNAIRVASGSSARPGAIAITAIDARSDEDAGRVRRLASRIASEMPGMSGFLGLVAATIGRRMVTISAWREPADLRQFMENAAHKEAVNGWFQSDGLAIGGHFDHWVPGRMGPIWVRCSSCGAMADSMAAEGKCACGALLPEPAPYW